MISIRKIAVSGLLLAAICTNLPAQYITKVWEYQPAPGQFINKTPWGLPASAESLIGGISGSLSLGAFGGHVVFQFENPVENHPDNPFGIDFTIFGNPSETYSEPAAVWVMNDENENGLPDDTWYELAGSDYFFSSTLKNYRVNYANPKMERAAPVSWTDNWGNKGTLQTNEVHKQPYYPLPEHFGNGLADSLVLSGTRIESLVEKSNAVAIKSHRRAFGYADNQVRGNTRTTVPDNPYTPEVENCGGDAFDIGWAVNEQGEYVNLERIHFVKVQTAVLANSGWLGEISTEITGAQVTSPDASISGTTEMIVVKNLPDTIRGNKFQIEAFAYSHGRRQKNQPLSWSANISGAEVGANNVLTFATSGELTLTARLAANTDITTTVSTYLHFDGTATSIAQENLSEIKVYPNPASENIFVEGANNATIEIFTINGRLLVRYENYQNKSQISVGAMPQGVYLVRVKGANTNSILRFVKR